MLDRASLLAQLPHDWVDELDLPLDSSPSKVVVAMSGGVDSSVTAGILKILGLEVIGVTLQLYDQGGQVNRAGSCCAGKDIHDARRVADKLSIPHYVLDYESQFRAEVIDDFVDGYLRGETPLPCVRCNQSVKFRDLMSLARDLGGQALATGHYVRRFPSSTGKPQLHQAIDPERDQSYFLFATTQEQLSFLRFPLGALTKIQTRDLAAQMDLPVSRKPDSQDICFVTDGNYAKLVERLRPCASEPGPIQLLDGTILGTHQGIIHYTVGQRKGLGIAYPEPLYVIALDPENKTVTVGPQHALIKKHLTLDKVNWLGGALPVHKGREITVKIRSTARQPSKALLYPPENQVWRLDLIQGEWGVAPGQACVFYDQSLVLGGGWIQRDNNT